MRILEVIALNVEDSLAAQEAGADRIELVSEMEVGGLSPQLSTVKEVVDAIDIPVNVMIRFRGDDFVYTDLEIFEMTYYIKSLQKIGANGIVYGGLNEDKTINEEQLNTIIKVCGDMDITFHRAIDECDEKYEQNFNLINGKITTVLTSGGLVNEIDSNINRLLSISNQSTRVLVGGGINETNYRKIIDSLPNCDFHIGSLAYNQGDFTKGINYENISNVKKILN